MTEEQFLQERKKLLACEAEIHGMIADNRMREIHGFSPAWTSDNFTELIDRYGLQPKPQKVNP